MHTCAMGTPINSRDKCPKCGAGSNETCGEWITWAAAEIERLKAEVERATSPSWTCGVRAQGSAGGNTPADCDWPVCGCDPYAGKVIAALEEAGHLVSAAR